MLHSENIERFINFLSPNASRKNATSINFKEDLSNITIKSIGLFGTREHICKSLLKLGFGDKCVFDALMNDIVVHDGTKSLLKPGIHAVMSIEESKHPTTISQANPEVKPTFEIVLFYWPVLDAFKIPKGLSDHGISRSNVSVLYLRVLHEMTDCVCIPVTMNEVMIFFYSSNFGFFVVLFYLFCLFYFVFHNMAFSILA